MLESSLEYSNVLTSKPVSANGIENLIKNLYDVFVNIRDDEAEHCKTMRACQSHGNLRSPHSYSESRPEDDDEPLCNLPEAADCEGIVDCLKKAVTSSPP
ncbi:Ubiquinol oxidase 4, chloroplastic/chromoplastic, partial [Cucurbita argyrosperma subsp. argyrosperma]